MFWNKQQKTLKPFPADLLTIVNNLRFLALHSIESDNFANSAKILQATPLFYTLFRNHLIISNSETNNYYDHISDKLVVSKNYGGNFLKTILYCSSLCKQNLKLKEFLNDSNSKIPSSIYDFNYSIPGQALEFSVGLALANKMLIKNNAEILSKNKIYCIFDQTDLISGRLYELMSISGALKLNNLIWLADFSGVDQRGFFADHTLTSFKMLFESNSWNHYKVGDGSNVELISKMISKAQNSNRPAFLEINSVSGHGSSCAGTAYSANLKIDEDEKNKLKERFGYELEFDQEYHNAIKDLTTNIQNRFNSAYQKYELDLNNADLKTKQAVNKFLDFKNNNQNYDKNFQLENYNYIPQELLNNNEFHIALMANEFSLSEDTAEPNPKIKNIISIGKRTSIVYGLASGLKASKYFLPFIVVNLSALYDWIPSINQNIFWSYKCPILVYLNNENVQEKTVIYNLIFSQIQTTIIFPHSLSDFNNSWAKACDTNSKIWTCIVISDKANENIKSLVKKDLKPNDLYKINILVIDLNKEKISALLTEFENQNFLINLVQITDPRLFVNFDKNKLFEILGDKPYVWIGIDNSHWIHKVRLEGLNQKIVVKSNTESTTDLVKEIINSYNKF